MLRAKPGRREYWTRERVLDGLRRFYSFYNMAPSSSIEFGRIARGYKSGDRNTFPAPGKILAYFRGMYEAWEATGLVAALPKCACGVVLEDYDKRSCETCKPRRISQAIRQGWSGRRKYVPTSEIDEEIRRVYQETRRSPKVARIKALAVRLGWPRYAVSARASRLGLCQLKESNWSAEELDLLERFVYLTPDYIARRLKAAGFHRSISAIGIMIQRLGLRKSGPFYSATQLSRCIGEDSHKVVRWITQGLLPNDRKPTTRTKEQGGDPYLIHDVDVYLFLVNHRDEYDVRKCNQDWLLATLIDFPGAHQPQIETRRSELESGQQVAPPQWSSAKWKERRKTTGVRRWKKPEGHADEAK